MSTGINEAKKFLFHKCVNCGSEKDIMFHHIVPLALGGNDIVSNIVPLCTDCHYLIHHEKNRKSNLTHSELIKQGIAKSGNKGGRKIGTLDKLTDELKADINLYLTDKNITQNSLMEKHHISRNTLKKYIAIIKTGGQQLSLF